MKIHNGHCPCGSQRAFNLCCAPVLAGQVAGSAEQLMRSRYCAFVLHNAPYLVATLHPSYRTGKDETQLQQSFTQTQWLGLVVLEVGEDWVEFVAFYYGDGDGDNFSQLHEKSFFTYENGQWFYKEGNFLPDIKLMRNQACPCASGKKIKKCHPQLLD